MLNHKQFNFLYCDCFENSHFQFTCPRCFGQFAKGQFNKPVTSKVVA